MAAYLPIRFTVLAAVSLVLIVLLCSSRASAHGHGHRTASPGKPISQLPGDVPAPDGELSLCADYSDVRGDHVALYLINRTANTIWLMGGDGNAFVKLEASTDPVDPPTSFPVRFPENRYMGFWPRNTGQTTALRVTFNDLPSPFTSHEGESMWVGDPKVFCENAGQIEPPAGGCGSHPGARVARGRSPGAALGPRSNRGVCGGGTMHSWVPSLERNTQPRERSAHS